MLEQDKLRAMLHNNLMCSTADYITHPNTYGGAVAWHAHACVVVYGIPVWIMPNGYCRVGHPDAPMVEREQAGRVIKDMMVDRVVSADVD